MSARIMSKRGTLPFQSIAEAWALYERIIVPPQAGSLQRAETKKAFYSGAGILCEMLMHCMSAGSEVSEADLAQMQRMRDELQAWLLEHREVLGRG